MFKEYDVGHVIKQVFFSLSFYPTDSQQQRQIKYVNKLQLLLSVFMLRNSMHRAVNTICLEVEKRHTGCLAQWHSPPPPSKALTCTMNLCEASMQQHSNERGEYDPMRHE